MALNAISMGYLAGLFGGTVSVPSFGSGATQIDRTPSAPWTAPKTEPSALVRTALAGGRFIDLRAPVLDARGAAEDYRRLFALHQGLTMLDALATRADEKSVSSAELTRLEKSFQSGLNEINGFLSDDAFESIRVARTAAGSSAKTTVGAAKPDYTYVTPAVHDGMLGEPVDAFQGDVRFSLTVSRLTGDTKVDFDLSEMGSTERTMGQVIAFMNQKLQTAGVETQFGLKVLPGEPKTLKIGDRTMTLPSTSDSYALQVKAISTETISFDAEDRSDAVFIAQMGGKSGALSLAKFQSDTGEIGDGAPAAAPGEGSLSVEGRALLADISNGLAEVKATQTGPDGSIYVLGEATATVDGQTLKGQRDVVLQKYDSAGQLVYTRTLGAASEATASGLAVGSDGRVAVVGSVTGALDLGAAGADARLSDSFVTVFDASGGELWTQRRGARSEDEATSVAFGADGSVYVGGRARSGMPGAASLGGWDGYLQTFSSSGLSLGAQQFGSAGDDAASRIAIEGSTLVVAGLENGRAVIRRYDITNPQAPVLSATRDLGALQGAITGVAIDGGRVLVTGSSANPSLAEGAATNGHSGGKDAFVARLDLSLTAGGSDRVTFVGGAGDDSAVSATVSGGKVWLTGQTDIVASASSQTAKGRLLRLDADTGTVEWDRSFMGEDGVVRPMTVSVAEGGSSVLDRLGLPTGEIAFKSSQRLVDMTSARAGDQFHLDLGGGRLRSVTIEAGDTYETLAKKIVSASMNRLDVKILPTDGVSGLRITLRPSREPIEIVAGSLGRDALDALGLSQTLVHQSDGLRDDRAIYALRMAGDLTLTSKSGIKAAKDSIQGAVLQVMAAYRKLTQLDDPQAAAMANVVYSEYQSKQIANYQAALLKLGGG